MFAPWGGGQVSVVFDLNFATLSAERKAEIVTLAKAAFCPRLAALGITCSTDSLVVVLSELAGSTATVATATLPAGTTSDQVNNLVNDIDSNPVMLVDSDGYSITSTGASFTSEGGNSAASATAFPALMAMAAAAIAPVLFL